MTPEEQATKKAQIIKEIGEVENKAKLTKASYVSRVNTLFRIPDFQDDIMDTINTINKSQNPNTLLNVMSSILATTKASKTFKEMFKEEDLDELAQIYLDEKEKLQEQKEKDGNSKREKDVEWDYLISLEEDITKASVKDDDRLLYRLYISPGIGYIPRNDFAQMKIVDTMDETDNGDLNYYVIANKSMLFNEYKTSLRYGQIKIKIGNQLSKDIPKLQQWMFQNEDGNPLTDNAISKKFQRAMKRISGKDISLTTVRRAFATHIKDLPNDDDEE